MLRIRSTALVVAALAIAGCAWFPTFDDVIPDKQKEYQKSQSLPDLEVPPDLATESIRDTLEVPDVDASGAASYSTYQERIAQRKRGSGSAEGPSAAKLGVLADETPLIVDAEPAVVWADLRPFWKDRGYALDLDDEDLGTLETGWVENHAKQERDRFKVSIEAGEQSGTTVLYLTHVGEALTPIGEGLEWRERPRDAGLEGRMAAHLKKALSGEPVAAAEAALEPAADPAPRPKPKIAPAEESGGAIQAELLNAGDGKAYLRVSNDFAKVWRNTGFALGQIGAKVEDEDRSRGSYYLRFSDTAAPKPEKGFFSSLAFWRDDDDDEFEIHLTDVGNNTEVIVLDPDGNWDNGATAARILRLLLAELNK